MTKFKDVGYDLMWSVSLKSDLLNDGLSLIHFLPSITLLVLYVLFNVISIIQVRSPKWRAFVNPLPLLYHFTGPLCPIRVDMWLMYDQAGFTGGEFKSHK